jgi:C-terminal processing protease CtpA/Prc
MTDRYLWRDEVPPLEPATHESPSAVLEASRAEPDRFSYLSERSTQTAFFEAGQYVGFGFTWRLAPTADESGERPRIARVYPDSPAAGGGFVRGTTIMAIDGIPTDTLVAEERLDTALGANEVGVTVTFRVQAPNRVHAPKAAERTVTLRKSEVRIDPVIDARLIEQDGQRIGYFGLSHFIETADEPLAAAFEALADGPLDALVVDLRYNGGGRLRIAQDLASWIVPPDVAGRDFVRYRHNARYTDWDQSVPFRSPSSGDFPGVREVVILTGPDTCSASETVINGLQPHVDVTVVGARTCGKPVGSYGLTRCDLYLSAIQFEMRNSAGVGGYFDGIAPVCPAEDDLSAPLGDPDEALLRTALTYLATGSCPRAAQNGGLRRGLAGPERGPGGLLKRH